MKNIKSKIIYLMICLLNGLQPDHDESELRIDLRDFSSMMNTPFYQTII